MEDTASSSSHVESELLDEGELGASKFPASDLFCEQMRSMVCSQDVTTIRRNQQHALHRFEKTNEMFERFNELSAVRFEAMQGSFKQHTKLLVELKKDLESVFRRIRNLKVKLSRQYPGAFEATHKGIKTLEDELEEDQNTIPQEQSKQEFSSLGEIFVHKSLEVEETGMEVSEGSTGSSTKFEEGNVPAVEEVQALESRPYKIMEDSNSDGNKDADDLPKSALIQENRTYTLEADVQTDSEFRNESEHIQIGDTIRSDVNDPNQEADIQSATTVHSREECQGSSQVPTKETVRREVGSEGGSNHQVSQEVLDKQEESPSQ